MGNQVLNVSEIVEQCGVFSDTPQESLKKLSELCEFYERNDLISIYNYILQNNSVYELLAGVVKILDSYKNMLTLKILSDILLQKKRPLEDEDELINLRVLCAKAISNYKDTTTLHTFLACLNNKRENYKIRLACADALGRIGDRYAVEPLIDVVKDEEEKSVYVKESATFALGLIGDTSAIDPLVAIMESKQGIWDKFSFLKEKIVEALGKININNNKVLRVFKMSLMDSSPMVRINTIEALMNSDYEEAEELIRTTLHDEDTEVQRNALIALYNMIGFDILDEVISLPGYSGFLKQEAKNIIEELEAEEEEEE